LEMDENRVEKIRLVIKPKEEAKDED